MGFHIEEGFTSEGGARYGLLGEEAKIDESILRFVRDYAERIDSRDPEDLRRRCADTLLFGYGGKESVVELNRMIPVVAFMAEGYRALGYKGSEITRAEYLPLDKDYCLVKIYLDMRFVSSGREQTVSDVKASYVLKRAEGTWKIIVQLDHQDLSEILKERGIA
jgi:hypothetical protein